MTLSPLSIEDLHWWVVSIPSAFNVVRHSDYDLVLYIQMPQPQVGVVSWVPLAQGVNGPLLSHFTISTI